MEQNTNFLRRYGEIQNPTNAPSPRFGHTANLVSKTTVVIFGGAISSPGNYTMTAELYLFNMVTNSWKKLESLNNGMIPHARAAHASVTVRENQLLVYGGSIGNGQYASEDLWFLDIKNNEEASWMRVPVEGLTPSVRYGHSMVYIIPILFLFAGSGRSELLNDVWMLSTEKTPFKWEKATVNGSYPLSRVYHTANLYKVAGNAEMMIVYGGRDKDNVSLNDICGIRKENNDWEWVDFTKKHNNGDIVPVGRHQHCAAFLGPFLFVVGGRVGQGQLATFDVFSMNKMKWYRFGNIALFRHSIWVYYNIISQDKYDAYLYIYGGFDGDNNSQINPNMFKINIVELFSQDESLKNELNDHISMLLLLQTQNKRSPVIKQSGPKVGFQLDYTVVAYQMGDDLVNNIRQLSLPKLAAEGQKIGDTKTARKKYVYDESLVREFLQLMPLPEHFEPLNKDSKPIILHRDYIISLIKNCKALVEKSPSLLRLRHPIKIFGSLYGQYNDLLRFFNFWGRPHEHRGDIESVNYLFLGNIVNRGGFSLEVLCLLLALKIKFPEQVNILRGSHDDYEVCKVYGLGEECKVRLNEDIDNPDSVFNHICDLFMHLPIAATINDKIFCVHSGISENIKTLDDIANMKKPYKIRENSIAIDLLWSVPEGQYEYSSINLTTNYRKKFFNENTVSEFLKNNKLNLIIRSHDIVDSGFEKIFDNKVISIFSCTNYFGIHGNNGGIIFIKKTGEIQPKILTNEEDYSIWTYSNMDYPPSPKRKLIK